MQKTVQISLLIVCTFVLFIFSCKKEIKEKTDTELPELPVNVTLKDIQIVLPAGANYDLSGHELLCYGVVLPVKKDGKTQAAEIKGVSNIAWLFDKENNPVMAGFVNDTTSEISVESTAKVILYYATGAAFRIDTVANMFIGNIGKVPEVVEWEKEFSGSWKANPRLLSSRTYMSTVNSMLKKIIGNPKSLDIRARTANLTVDANDIRSGIQVFEDGISQISIQNNYRRRAYAYIYKTKFKKEGATSYTNITPATLTKELVIDAPSGITSTVGTGINVVLGKGMSFATTKNGPVVLDLKDDESEAIYDVRIIGVGGQHTSGLTSAEDLKVSRLVVETFALDFLLPAIGTAMGGLGEEQKGNFVKAADALMKLTPGIYDALNKGDFTGALISALVTIASDKGLEAGANIFAALSPSKAETIEAGAGKMGKYLLIVDGILTSSDFVRIGHDIQVSKKLEVFEVKARASKVSLTPKEAIAISNSQQWMETVIKDQATPPTDLSYEWSTTGKFGYLIDTKGNRGASFTSTDKGLGYNVNVPNNSLSDGDNWEYIYVKVYQAGMYVGTDTAKVNVKKSSLLMKPDGITLSGKKNSTNEVKLYLELANKSVTIKPNPERDYKTVWTTTGKYGKLLAKDIDGATVITTYDDNTVRYECQDDQAKNKEEIITARVYSKAKNETGYKLFDEVKGKIKIDNDDKKKIIHVPLSVAHKDTEEKDGSFWCYKFLVATFAEDPDAVSYSLKFYDTPIVIGAPSGDNWSQGKFPTYSPWDFVRPGYDGKNYTVYHSYSHGGSWTPGNHMKTEASGMAQVIITLK